MVTASNQDNPFLFKDGDSLTYNLPTGLIITQARMQIGSTVYKYFTSAEEWTNYSNTERSVTVNGNTHSFNGPYYNYEWSSVFDISSELQEGANTLTFNTNTFSYVGTPGYAYFKYYIEYEADPAPVDVIKATIDSSTVQLPLLSVNDNRIPTWTFEGKSYTANFLRVKKDGQIYCLWIATLPDDDDSGIHFQFKGQILCVKKTT